MTQQLGVEDLDPAARQSLMALASPEPFVGLPSHQLFRHVLDGRTRQLTEDVVARQPQFVSNEPHGHPQRHGWVLAEMPDSADAVVGFLRGHLAQLAVDFGLGSGAEAEGALELSDVIITAHGDGDFLGPHHDDGWPGLRNGRLLSFVYWFHDLPRRFDGGSLSLAGWNRLSGVISPTGPKVHLEPDNDTMVVFPSATRHELHAVRCAPDNFRAGLLRPGGLHPALQRGDLPVGTCHGRFDASRFGSLERDAASRAGHGPAQAAQGWVAELVDAHPEAGLMGLVAPLLPAGVGGIVAIEVVQEVAQLAGRREVVGVDVAVRRRHELGHLVTAPIHGNRPRPQGIEHLLGDVVRGEGVLEGQDELVAPVERDPRSVPPAGSGGPGCAARTRSCRPGHVRISWPTYPARSERSRPFDPSQTTGEPARSTSGGAAWISVTSAGSRYGCQTSLVRS